MLHHLDHAAPFCALQGIPLVVTEATIEEAARRYYPDLQVIFWDYLEATHQLVSQFDRIFTTLPRPIFDDAFFAGQLLQGKKVPTVWLPHGNSDKGRLAPLMEGLVHERDALVYGRKMIDFMKEKNVFAHLQSCSPIGNYRLRYFHKHADFYRRLVDPLLDPSKKTILYAPTWRDEEGSCSLDAVWPHLAAGLPSGYQLAVKLHPNIPNVFEGNGIVFLNDFPPVYPLLERADVYIGDMSSVGYDFLALDRPMFFLNAGGRDRQTDPGLYLFRCGVEVRPEEFSRIYEIIEENMDQTHLSPVRKEVYEYTFQCKTA